MSYQLVWVDPVAGDLSRLRAEEPSPDTATKQRRIAFERAIRFENVSFCYSGTDHTLPDDVSREIDKARREKTKRQTMRSGKSAN